MACDSPTCCQKTQPASDTRTQTTRKCEHPQYCHDKDGYHICGTSARGEPELTSARLPCPDQVDSELVQPAGGWFQDLLAVVQMANVETNDHGRECEEIAECNTCENLHTEEGIAEKRLLQFHLAAVEEARAAGRREMAREAMDRIRGGPDFPSKFTAWLAAQAEGK